MSVPGTTALDALADDEPLGADNPAHGDQGLEEEQNDEGCSDEAIHRRRTIPRRRKDVEMRQVDLHLAEDLCGGDSGDGPERGRAGRDEEVDEDEERVREHEVAGLAAVEGLAEGGDRVLVELDTETAREHRRLAAVVAHPGGTVLVYAAALSEGTRAHDSAPADLGARQEDDAVGDHGAVADGDLRRPDIV